MMLKSKKKLFSILLSMVMVFSLLAGTAFAVSPGEYLGGNAIPPDPNDANCSTCLATAQAPSISVTVTFIMEAADDYWEETGAFHDEFQVTITSETAKLFSLTDLLTSIDNSSDDYTFYTKQENTIAAFTDTSSYLYGVNHNGTLFQPDTYDLWGWVFRINDEFPVETFTPENPDPNTTYYRGTSVLNTYLSTGDVVHFYYDYPVTESGYDYTADYMRLAIEDQSSGSVTARLQSHKASIYSPTMQMQVYDYTDFTTPTMVYLYNASGIIASSSTNASGEVTFSGLNPGRYILRTDSVVLNDDPNGNYDGFFFKQTSGYKTITIA